MYGLVGKTLGHSFSPELHRMIWGCEDYRLLPMDEAGAREFFRSRRFDGVNVTIPYKRLALELCDRLDPFAKAVGAVNTVVNRGGVLWGYNTDFAGLKYSVDRAGISLGGKKVLIFGSGGASKTALALAEASGAAQTLVISRSGENNYETLSQHYDGEILINATPVGMWPEIDGICADPGDFTKCTGVVDIVYNPLETRLVYRARQLGIPSTAGLSMLAAQAVAAAELFTGNKFPDETAELCTRSLEREIGCIVLIGMPGCGKTSVGYLLAKRLGRTFIDTDELIKEAAGMTVPEIFFQKGEAEFRKLESIQLKKACLTHGTVISCGGGAVLDEGNRFHMASCGKVYYLYRDTEKLVMGGRPLSTGLEAVRELYRLRRELYETACEVTIDCNGTVAEAANEIARDFER